jgi:hypothetical protein
MADFWQAHDGTLITRRTGAEFFSAGNGLLVTQPASGASSPPTAPTIGSTTSITQTGATINWTDNSADETGFKVEYAVSPYSSWTAATTAADATSYALTGLTPGVTYKARVAATNLDGDSDWVETAEFTTTALVKKLRVANLHSDAIGATSITGVVWAAASGQIVGAEIGEFSGGSIVSDGSGGAKLEIAVTEFSGGALTTSDTPKVLIRGETGGVAHTTGIIDATVFEE